MTKFSVVLKNSTVRQIAEFLESWPSRYNRYRDRYTEGCWKFSVSKTSDYTLRMKQMNIAFDPKGYKYGYLVISVILLQQGHDVLMECNTRWAKNVIFGLFMLFFASCAVFIGGVLFIRANDNQSGVMLILCSIMALLVALHFVRSYKTQERLAKSLFVKLVENRTVSVLKS